MKNKFYKTRSFSTSNSGPSKDQIVINGTVYNAVAVYNNPLSVKSAIRRDLRGKAGIYAWVNKVNGKAYVGSSVNLSNRICSYFEPAYKNSNANLIIVRAMLKYGLLNFRLVI